MSSMYEFMKLDWLCFIYNGGFYVDPSVATNPMDCLILLLRYRMNLYTENP